MGYFGSFGKGKGIPFMTDANKGSIRDIIGREVSLKDYGYINGDNGVYACVCFNEIPNTFFFTNKIFTDALKQIEADEKIDDLKKCGIVFGIAHSKNGREYISFEIIEDEQSELPF